MFRLPRADLRDDLTLHNPTLGHSFSMGPGIIRVSDGRLGRSNHEEGKAIWNALLMAGITHHEEFWSPGHTGKVPGLTKGPPEFGWVAFHSHCPLLDLAPPRGLQGD